MEEEKRKEEEARELKRRERERRVRERKAREERERKAKEEREWKERERKAEEEMERERKAEEERERREEERGTGQRSGGAIDEVRLESESEREETRAGETMKLKKAGGKGSRRSLRQRGLPASDTVSYYELLFFMNHSIANVFLQESSATDSEENNVCGPGTSRTEVESEQLPAERGADGGGGGGEGGGVMKNSSMAQKEGTESTVSSETEVEGDREKEGEGGETRVGSGGEEASGDGRVDGATLYSPEVTPTSPTRDTMKLGPVR